MHVPHIASLHHCLCVSHLCIKMWIGFSWYFLPPQTEVEPQVFLFLLEMLLRSSEKLSSIVCLYTCCGAACGIWWRQRQFFVYLASLFSTSPNCWNPHFYFLLDIFSLSLLFLCSSLASLCLFNFLLALLYLLFLLLSVVLSLPLFSVCLAQKR